MKQRLLTMALLAGCIVMGAAAFLLNAGQDRKAPRITIEDEEISYAEGISMTFCLRVFPRRIIETEM